MRARKLENVRERLLIAGIAPRHVRRYLQELNEHFDDARRAELERGVEPAAAEQAAWERLGSDESLVQSVLERPELRSTGARFPALVFGLGPALAWLGLVVATIAVVQQLPRIAAGSDKPAWLFDAAHAFCTLYVRGLPVLGGIIVFVLAARRRLPVYWPLAGAALVDVLAGTLTVQALGATAIGVNSSLLPLLVPFSDEFGPRDLSAFADGLWRAGGMLAVSLLAYRLATAAWLRLQRQRGAAL